MGALQINTFHHRLAHSVDPDSSPSIREVDRTDETHGIDPYGKGPFQSASFKQSPSDRRLHNDAHLKSRAWRNAVDLKLILIRIEFDRLIAA
jgi:hypothetical protein